MPQPKHSETCQPGLPTSTPGTHVKGPQKPEVIRPIYVSFRLNHALSAELDLAARCLDRPPSLLVKQLVEASLRERLRVRVERASL